MNLTERLRSVVRPSGNSIYGPGSMDGSDPTSVDPALSDVADLLGGEWREVSGQRYIVIERSYPSGQDRKSTRLKSSH